jgi:hypothetical protein
MNTKYFLSVCDIKRITHASNLSLMNSIPKVKGEDDPGFTSTRTDFQKYKSNKI